MEPSSINQQSPAVRRPCATLDRDVASSNWRSALPVLTAPGVTIRNLRLEDAPSLCAHLATEEVARFISPPPTTIEGFEQFIRWAIKSQSEGRYACFAVVPHGTDQAVGIIQLRNLGEDFRLAEWGFAIGSRYWGTGLFVAAAQLVLDFAFATVGIERLEARCVVQNGRGVGALRKLHAVPERFLPGGLVVGENRFDQVLWIMTRLGYQARARMRRKRLHPLH